PTRVVFPVPSIPSTIIIIGFPPCVFETRPARGADLEMRPYVVVFNHDAYAASIPVVVMYPDHQLSLQFCQGLNLPENRSARMVGPHRESLPSLHRLPSCLCRRDYFPRLPADLLRPPSLYSLPQR